MFDKILVPLDGSELARQVFPYVSEMAAAFGSRVDLVTVCEPEETKTCQLYIDGEAERLRGSLANSSVKFKTAVLVGRSAELILDYAEKNDINLIVLCSHGRSGISTWSLGSTTSKVLHKIKVPLIMVQAREKMTESDKTGVFSRILVPLDGSERSAAVLPGVAEIARKLKCEVILLQVLEPGKHVHSVGGLDYIQFEERVLDAAKKKAQQYLDKASSRFAGSKATVRSEVRVGDSAAEIIKFADEARCGMIAMASHGRSGIASWMFGSVTSKVLQAGKHSVMLVPAITGRG